MNKILQKQIGKLGDVFDRILEQERSELLVRENGRIRSIGDGIARVRGLPGVRSEELLLFEGGVRGIAFNLDPKEVGVVLLDDSDDLESGSSVRRTGRVVEVPVGEQLTGRVIDPLGRTLDNGGKLEESGHDPLERPAPDIMDRAPVRDPLQTGWKVIDSLLPIGRGQRQLILGDRQTGKTTIALDTILNQTEGDVVCIYCAIGQRASSTVRVIETLRQFNALTNSIVVVSTEDDPPGLQYIAPYAATTMAEFFRDRGQDALIVYDDITRHARAYRELSLLLKRPPGREAYPGDIFYIHSRLLERATHLKKELGGGSLTALPIVETQEENIAEFIPTNLISITDGQIYLSPKLFRKGILPPVDVGKSVSRVGGKTQLPPYRMVTGDLRLVYSQYEEMETFTRFGARLEESTRKTIERGKRIREILKQREHSPLPVSEQFIVLFAVKTGVLDEISPDKMKEAELRIRRMFREECPDLYDSIGRGETPGPEVSEHLEIKLKEELKYL